MRAPIVMVCFKLLVVMTGLLTIAEARAEARHGYLRVESRTKVGDQENKCKFLPVESRGGVSPWF